MMNEEKYIREKLGKGNPFSVPDGYFDKFTSELMDKLPEREPCVIKPIGGSHKTLRRLMYAAACACIAILSTAVYFTKIDVGQNEQAKHLAVANTISHKVSVDTYEEDVADYAMIDNSDIYAYLSSEQ